MRSTLLPLFALAALSLAGTGCSTVSRMEAKMGRGLRDVTEFVRLGEISRSIEQTSVFEGSDIGRTTGFVTGFNKSLARTVVGAFEIVTFAVPPYDPVLTSYITPDPVYPDSWMRGLPESTILATDNQLGYSGGTIGAGFPGSRFSVFSD